MQALQGGEAVLEVERAWNRCYEDGSRFNDALLVLLHKNVSGSMDDIEYDPGDTRPFP